MRLYGTSVNDSSYAKATFFKSKTIIEFNCSRDKAVEISKMKLSTSFDVWFVVNSKFMTTKDGRPYTMTTATLMHYELFVPKIKQMQENHEYSMSIQNKMFNNEIYDK
jgi:hypothetical protein